VAYLRAFIERYPGVPHLAIGGITPDNVSELVNAGARGVAVSSCVCGADHPSEVVAAIRRVVEQAVAYSES
jgi:thiamine monophosphate synthase